MNHVTFTRFIVLSMALVSIGLVSWTPNAAASTIWPKDAKVYPGTTCLPFAGSQKLHYADDGSITNQDTKRSIMVNCPIIRDLTKKRRGLSRTRVKSAQGNLSSCKVRVIKQTPTGSGYKTLKIKESRKEGRDFLFYLGDNFPENAMYMLSCKLLPGARLISYYAHERRASGSLPPPF